jgi:hypothetical protein
MISQPDAATSNSNIIYKTIRTLINKVTDIQACLLQSLVFSDSISSASVALNFLFRLVQVGFRRAMSPH